MELPDLQKYKEKFSQKNFIEKIQRVAKRAGVKLVYVALILPCNRCKDTVKHGKSKTFYVFFN